MDQSAVLREKVGDGAVVFRRSPPVVAVLNSVADFIFTQLLNGRLKQEIAFELRKRFSELTPSNIDEYIEDASLLLEDLLEDDELTDRTEIDPALSFENRVWHFDRIIKIGSAAMRLQIGCDHFDDLLLTTYGPAMQELADAQSAEFHLQVIPVGDNYRLKRSNADASGLFNHHGAFLEIQRSLLSTAHKTRSTNLIMHAGAILDEPNDQSIILAGCSGSGKSSLTAAFLSRGYTFVADDTAIIDADTKELWCLNLPLRLKEGTWQHVRPHVSETFEHWTPVEEPSGRKVWQLYPKRTAAKERALAPPSSAILFPVYEPNAATEIVRIETLAAMALMIESGAWFKTSERAMAETVDWLSRTCCYSVIFSSAEDVVTAIQDLIRSDAVPNV
ncbi:MAG: hypothetical protein ACR2QF_09270 [Geminicoccaceae bacterium]